MAASFLDSNVLIYLASGNPAKADRVEALLAAGALISVQVLNETANVLRRKAGFSWPETHAFLAAIRPLVDVAPLTIATHDAGLRLAELYRLSLYDAMIVAAARLAGCDMLWSEDMHDGLVIDDALRIRNPFAEKPDT
ncbi:PIN domain-containing protein [Sphingomonas nostoxanthinifaciens]|uniref:PIN domain-containing protein n=1 Tax=Sphingomonas nostoxanthinifaciens TaxID=2872652 RepID=UPI001CC1F868|nr:PIN domain-containing protein [Sphingomonas nostoxanthinifaciens]UAK24502.1 PIN domain-containing protein [Sphingomonas nostoxanthinifaciens]